MRATRTVWFPLRSNVAYFETTGPRLDLEGRVKELAILAEELFFEPGILDVSVTEHGLSSFWTPPGTLDEEEIRKRREGATKGAPFVLAVARQEGPGKPAEAPTHVVISGPLQRGFVAEYELSLKEWGLDDRGWANLAWIPGDAEAAAKKIAAEEDRREWPIRDAPELSDNHFLDDRLKKDLNLDLARGAVMGTPVALDELHAPMLEHKGKAQSSRFEGQEPGGATALRVWVPAFDTVPWKDIIALHDHDAIGAFRQKLIEAEEAVADLPEAERLTALKEFQIEAMARKIQELVPTRRRVAVEVGEGFLLDLLSAVVPFVGTMASGVKGLATLQREQAEWTAVLIRLRTAKAPALGRPRS